MSKAREVRILTIKSLVEAGSGHTAGALGLSDFLATLYFGKIINYKSDEPEWSDRDRVVLSCGHYAPGFYATLATAGYFPTEELMSLRKLGSRLQGHPEKHVYYGGSRRRMNKQLPGVENSSGPLGQGVSVAVGMAMSAKMDRKRWNVICIDSDGEQEEGQTWEAYMAAVKYKLGNLTFVIDCNDIQISGKVRDVMPLEPFKEKLSAFGLKVYEVDGHNHMEIIRVFEQGKIYADQPKAIILRTVPGKGVSFMENKYEWHGKAPTKDEGEKAIYELSNKQ